MGRLIERINRNPAGRPEGARGGTWFRPRIARAVGANVASAEVTAIGAMDTSGKADHSRLITLLLFVNSWSVRMTLERNEGLILSEFGRS